MTRLVFVDVDDTLLTPPYDAVRRVATFLGKSFPPPDAFINRSHVDYHKAFPGLFKSSAEMWAIALMSLPFGHFRSQSAMAFDMERMSALLADTRLYLISKNPPSFTRWRVQRLREIFNVDVGDRYIACGPIFTKGESKRAIIEQIALDRNVPPHDCLLVDDSIENLQDVAAAGVRCAVVVSSWNRADIEPLQRSCPNLLVINSTDIPDVLQNHLQSTALPPEERHFLVPPLSLRNLGRLLWVFLKRRWLYGEALPKWANIVPIARNPITSYFYQDPHKALRARLQRLVTSPGALSQVRVLSLKGHPRPMLVPVGLQEEMQDVTPEQKVRKLRSACRALMQSRGHTFVREARFYFTGLDRTAEKARILKSDRIARAKQKYMTAAGATQQDADALAARHADELLTSRSYLMLAVGEWVLDTMLSKIFKAVHLKSHPMVRRLEHDHFLFYAASHRSYLDSAVLWSILSHSGQSSPYAVAADKMRSVWFGRLGSRAGTFFLRRTFVDDIYAAVIGEHVGSMQQPGAALEVFLEGQRSRSGLTLPPKKGIASVVWGNMDEHSKVAIVPVSFTYNKLPESEKLIKERFDERKKLGLASLREASDMKIKRTRKRPLLERMRRTFRRYKTQLISECHIQFAEPIVLHKSSDKARLQSYLDETMLRINGATAVLPSSVLCLYLLGTEDKHATFDESVAFLRFCRAMLGLYTMPTHLFPDPDAQSPEDEVSNFIDLPFVNRKFKRAGIHDRNVLCINELDLDRASFYRNNVLHFFALPGILSHVLTEMNHGHIEELHRCFDHMFAKLQKTYFLPRVDSARTFIDRFIELLSARGLVAATDQQWRITEGAAKNGLLHVLAGLGSDIIQGDLPHLMDTIRRSSMRQDVHVPCRLTAIRTTTQVPARASAVTQEALTLACAAEGQLGAWVDFKPEGADVTISGVISHIEAGTVAIAHTTGDTSVLAQHFAAGMVEALMGSLVFKEEMVGTGVITNLSPNGAFITTELTLATGDFVTCAIAEGGGLQSFELRGKVTRMTRSGVGVRFEQLSVQDEVQIGMLGLAATLESARRQTTGQVDFHAKERA